MFWHQFSGKIEDVIFEKTEFSTILAKPDYSLLKYTLIQKQCNVTNVYTILRMYQKSVTNIEKHSVFFLLEKSVEVMQHEKSSTSKYRKINNFCLSVFDQISNFPQLIRYLFLIKQNNMEYRNFRACYHENI